MSDKDLDTRLAGIELVIFDVDGVLTDGKVWIDTEGRESIRFNIQDGYGVFRGYRAGLQYAIISGRQCEAVEHRAKALQITQVHQGQLLSRRRSRRCSPNRGWGPAESPMWAMT